MYLNIWKRVHTFCFLLLVPLSATIGEPIVQTVNFGRPAVLTCNYEGDQGEKISWMKDGKPSSRYDGSLFKIESVQKDDEGLYQCFIRNELGSAKPITEIKLKGKFDPPKIIRSFDEGIFPTGATLFLECVATGNPKPEITWYIDSKKIENNEKYRLSHQVTTTGDKISYLNISDVQTIDGGLYKCEAISKVGTASHSTRLYVHGLPNIRPMEKKMIIAGGNLTVNCPFVGYPIEAIIWERDERTLPTYHRQKVFPNGTLIIQNVNRELDQATYTCIAKAPDGNFSLGNLVVQVLELPVIKPFAFEPNDLNGGTKSTIMCTVTGGDLPAKISWLKDGHAFKPSTTDEARKVLALNETTSVLQFDNLDLEDTGTYTCRAENVAGLTQYWTELRVIVPPRWILEPTDASFAPGQDARIQCKADGFPQPQVTWKKASSQELEFIDLQNNVEEGTLTIRNIQKSDEGNYVCEARNGIGTDLSAVIAINLLTLPQFEIKSRHQTIRKGQTAVLQCTAKGAKPINITWKVNNKPVKMNEKYTIQDTILPDGVTSNLNISRTNRGDSVAFMCNATNWLGSDESTINLIVQGPEAPHGLDIVDKTSRSVHLSWIAPYSGSSPIQQYIVEYKVAGGTWENDTEMVSVAGHETLVSVILLRPFTPYHFRIIAENDIGTSEPSEFVRAITLPEAPSGAPTDISVEPAGRNMLNVSWKPPQRSEWNGEILGFNISYRISSHTDQNYTIEEVTFNKDHRNEHHLIIYDLIPYTQYSVFVQAFNKLGPGPSSNLTKQYTAEGVPEQPPQNITCTSMTSQSIKVSWNSPPLISANGIIKGYKVIFGPSETWFNESTKDKIITSSTGSILHGLKKYTNYRIEILAYTIAGDSDRSPPIYCKTDPDVPETLDIKALVNSSKSISVSWKTPSQLNGIITHCTVYWKEHSTEAKPMSAKVYLSPMSAKKYFSPISEMNYEVKNLETEMQYKFWVTASTFLDEGHPSNYIVVAPSNRVPARIASFGGNFTYNNNIITLSCLTVGNPVPIISWKKERHRDEQIRHYDDYDGGSESLNLYNLPDGSLEIYPYNNIGTYVYTCSVTNDYGRDQITYRIDYT